MSLYRRKSAGGQALHHWQLTGKHTTIHIVYEMEGALTAEALAGAIETKLLSRFPRFRGHVTADEMYWCVPEMVNPWDYVCEIELAAESEADERGALMTHIAQQMILPLPLHCSWNVHLVRFGGRTNRCCVLWRISHTVADGVVLAQIMSNVLCDIATTPTDDSPDPTEQAEASPLPVKREVPAGCLERSWRFVCGVCFVIALLFWPSDRHTILQLGPHRWRRRLSERLMCQKPGSTTRQHKLGQVASTTSEEEAARAAAAAAEVLEKTKTGAKMHDGHTQIAVGDAVSVNALKDRPGYDVFVQAAEIRNTIRLI